MKTNTVVIVAMILFVILTHEPPVNSSAQGTSYRLRFISKPDTVHIANANLLDSVKLLVQKVDSSKLKCKKRLSLLKKQQQDLLKQIQTLDTLSLTVRNEEINKF
jgi:hypothetical protein